MALGSGEQVPLSHSFAPRQLQDSLPAPLCVVRALQDPRIFLDLCLLPPAP